MDLYELNTQEEGEEKRQYSAGSFDEDGVPDLCTTAPRLFLFLAP